jgi:integrase
MASVERRGNKFRLIFRYAGKKYQHPLRTVNEREATACVERVEENLRLLERGRLNLPPDAHLPTFLLSDGKLNEAPVPRARLTLGDFRDRYIETHSQGSLEAKTLQTIRTHFTHWVESFGESFDIQSLTMSKLQEHVNRRAKCIGIRKRPLSPVTTKKELATLRAAWNWAVQAGLLVGAFPNRGLRFPKTSEKPPFRTFAEVSELVLRENITGVERQELWDCVFLTLEELTELLRHVEATAKVPVVHPMFVFAAMTGARRSEILRLRWHDIDNASQTVLLHERKKSKGKQTTRRVPLAPALIATLEKWKANKTQSKTQSLLVFPSDSPDPKATDDSIIPNDAHDLFKQAIAGSKWRHLRGWHMFRHSFISNCAAKGVDQRMIDEWVGHTTEAMRRRYRHLIPGQQRQVIQSVFG